MLKIFLMTLLLLLSTSLYADCKKTDEPLAVTYRIISQSNGKVHSTSFILWRNGKQIVHEHPQTNIAELWEQTSSGKLRLVRYFNREQRGIEYQPNEINAGKGESDWSLKQHLISDRVLNSHKPYAVQGEPCQQRALYRIHDDRTQSEFVWDPQLHIPREFSRTTPQGKQHWKIESINQDRAKIQAKFTRWNRFDTTDYIDVGDNESDPFLMKMINLGFVEHGSSGFYDADGHAIGHPHH